MKCEDCGRNKRCRLVMFRLPAGLCEACKTEWRKERKEFARLCADCYWWHREHGRKPQRID